MCVCARTVFLLPVNAVHYSAITWWQEPGNDCRGKHKPFIQHKVTGSYTSLNKMPSCTLERGHFRNLICNIRCFCLTQQGRLLRPQYNSILARGFYLYSYCSSRHWDSTRSPRAISREDTECLLLKPYYQGSNRAISLQPTLISHFVPVYKTDYSNTNINLTT
jgi:hypothetical protein